eukprot:2665945-Prymnesium_polylepis.2
METAPHTHKKPIATIPSMRGLELRAGSCGRLVSSVNSGAPEIANMGSKVLLSDLHVDRQDIQLEPSDISWHIQYNTSELPL